MMVGFGECTEPRDDTIDLMETYVIEFISNISKRSLTKSQRSGFNSIQLRDLLKVIEDDEKKFLRIPYLITGLQSMDKYKKQIDPVSSNAGNKNLFAP